MSTLSLSLMRQIVVALFPSVLGLLTIFILLQSIGFIEMVVQYGAPPIMYAQLTSMLAPRLLSIILPLALAFVVIFIYMRLSTDREIVVMQTSGLSPLQISTPALQLSFWVMVVLYAFNLYIIPLSMQTIEAMKWHIRYNLANITIEEGKFNAIDDDVTLYFKDRGPNGELIDLFIHNERDNESPKTIIAKQGIILQTDEGDIQIVVDYGSQQQVNVKTGQYSILYFDKTSFLLYKKNEGIDQLDYGLTEMPFHELVQEIQAPGTKMARMPYLSKEINRRLASPLLAPLLTIIALLSIFIGEFSRRKYSFRPFIGGIMILFFQVLHMSSVHLALPAPVHGVVIYGVLVVPIIIGLLILARPPTRLFPPRLF